MATTSALLPPIKVETLPSSPPPPSESNLIEHEPPEKANTFTVDIPPPPPHLVNSIDGLRSLSTALSVFLSRYDDLNDHLDFIETAIDSKLHNHLLTNPNPNPNHKQSTLAPLPEMCSNIIKTLAPDDPNAIAVDREQNHEVSRKSEEADSSKKPDEIDVSKKPKNTDVSKKPKAKKVLKKTKANNVWKRPEETDILKKPEETDISKKAEETDLLKKSTETDVSKKSTETDASMKVEQRDVSKKAEVKDVSKKAEEKDVWKNFDVSELEKLCETMSGRGIKRYIALHLSDINKLREEVPKALKLAKDPARLVLDGVGRFFLQGCRAYFKASEEISRRLASIVFLECFLMISSDIEIAKEEEKYAEEAAIDWRKRMIREGGLAKADEADARGLLLFISGFGIPNGVFKNEDIWDLIRVSNVKEISTALRRSIILIPKIPEIIDWMVKNKMEIEAVDIAYTFGLEDKCPPRTILTTFLRNRVKDKQHGSSSQAAIKRQLADMKSLTKCLKAHKVDPSKLLPDWKIDEITSHLEKELKELDSKASEEKPTQKRKAKEAEPSRKPKQQEPKRMRLSAHNDVPLEQKTSDHGYGRSSYNGLTQPSSYFDGLTQPSSYINAYSASSVLRGSENVTSSVPVGSGAGMLTSSYAASAYGANAADPMANRSNGQAYDWHNDNALVERYLGQNYTRQIQAYDPQPSTAPGLIGLYSRPSGSSLDSFAGLPNPGSSAGVSARGGGSASDLYSFADSVVESESYRAGGGPQASGSGTMRSSYLY